MTRKRKANFIKELENIVIVIDTNTSTGANLAIQWEELVVIGEQIAKKREQLKDVPSFEDRAVLACKTTNLITEGDAKSKLFWLNLKRVYPKLENEDYLAIRNTQNGKYVVACPKDETFEEWLYQMKQEIERNGYGKQT